MITRKVAALRRIALLDLVVAVLVALLVALALAPALARLQRSSGEAQCQSNLRRWSQAMALYVADNHGWYPTNRVASGTIVGAVTNKVSLTPDGQTDADGNPKRFASGPNWVEALYPYLWSAATKTGVDWKSFRVCPKATTRTTSGAGGPSSTSYMTYVFNINLVEQPSSLAQAPNTLMMLRVKHIPPAASKGMRDELQSGLSYVRHHPSLKAFIVLAAATTFLGFALLTFLPVFAQQVFHEGAGTYSRLMAFSGAGSILGALTVAWLGKFKRMGLTALLMQAVYGALIVAFAVSRVLWLSDIFLFLTGAALMVVFSTVTSLVQMIAPNEMRGRVMSIYMLAFRGGMPLGSLVSGYLATLVGAPKVIAVNGVLLIAVAGYFLVRSHGVREA